MPTRKIRFYDTMLSPLEIHHVKDVLREDIMTLLVPEKIIIMMVTVRGVLLANIKMKQEKQNVRSVPPMGTALEAPLRSRIFEGCDLCPQGKFSNIYHFQDPIIQANCADQATISITISSVKHAI